ncbi:MAG: hypothetical protein HY291_10185 [Planctomycetes bacterium]|nr:hypothetical protein [Planctomycetota bacterium]
MRVRFFRAGVGVLAAIFSVLAPAARAEEPKPVVRAYKLSLVSNTAMNSGEGEKKSEADTVLSFQTAAVGAKVDYTCAAIFTQTKLDGQIVQYADMSKAKYATKDRDGNLIETNVKEAEAGLKEMLQDYFSAPLISLEIDGQGRETKRTVSEKPNAKTLIHNGMAANMRLFLSAYDEKNRAWEEEKEVSMGKGGFAKGAWKFEKTDAGKDNTRPGRIAVKVEGAASADAYKLANAATEIRGAKFEIAGTQIWDAELRSWVAGDLGMRFQYDVYDGEKKLFTAAGNIIAKLELTDPKP